MHRLFARVDIASLAVFRIVFGALMVVAIMRYFVHGWIDQFFIAPRLFFPYPGLEWIVPLAPPAMYALFAVLAAAAAGIMLGWRYRLSAAVFCAGFTYAHLIDRTTYLNHYYLISLLGALALALPLDRAGSLDVWRRRVPRQATAPAWAVWLLRFQLGVVYVFGAVAKLNTDWLVQAQPLRMWLAANGDVPLLGPWLERPWVSVAFSQAGFAFDAAVVPLLLWRRTRALAYGAVLLFHLLTAVLFPIGMFPWVMIGLTPIFFAPDWPRRLLATVRCRYAAAAPLRLPASPPVVALTWRQRAGAAALGAYALVQVALPLRHWAYDGDLHWTEQGFRFAWQIMAMEKFGRASFTVTDSANGAMYHVAPADELTRQQAFMMATQPDMILTYAHDLARRYAALLGHRVEVRADVFVTLNGRPSRRYVDPRVDLADIAAGSPAVGWLLPADGAGDDPPGST